MVGYVLLGALLLAAVVGAVGMYGVMVKERAREGRADAATLARAVAEREDALSTALRLEEEFAEERRRALAVVPITDHSAEWPHEAIQTLYAGRCGDCGCIHTVACPRIKRARFAENGITRLEVEYFATWDHTGVVAVDDFMEQNEPPTASAAVRVTG